MVSVTFKAVYLFLALFTLPPVLAAPALVALDVRHNTPTREETVAQSLNGHTLYRKFRAKGLPPITWNVELEREAWNIVSSCSTSRLDSSRSTLSGGLSQFTEDTHV